ncbi:MAG: ParB/RepB/Spo0J family partition protein [Patescibacteria group bacterium]|nr:ParB/RepB/Spo0J family partition protein [Patescibacteria group bacterium]
MSKSKTNSLPVNQLQPNPFQPRDKIKKEDIADLVKSVKSYGIIEPLVVAHTPAGYQIIAGERRWRAAKAAGLSEVPIHIRKTSPKQMLELALVENVQRKNLNPIERAKGFQRLIREFNFSISDLAEKIGKSPSYVSNSIRLLDLPDAIKDGVIGEQISEGHARALAGLDNEQVMIDCYKKIVRESASVRKAERLVRKIKTGRIEVRRRKTQTPTMAIRDEKVKKFKETVTNLFKAPTYLDLHRSNRQTKVTITLKGTIDKTQQDLERMMKLLKSSN